MDVAPPGAQMVQLPCAQGTINACAHIATTVGACFLVNGRDGLTPPLMVREDLITRATERAIVFYKGKLIERKHLSPEDKSVWFNPVKMITEWQTDGAPFAFGWRTSGGFVTHRAHTFGDGVMPRLVDELATADERARRDNVAQAVILTCLDYTRCILLRKDGRWLYDSHGLSSSTLYFYESLNALASHVLALCGVSTPSVVAENLEQMRRPDLRRTDGEFDALCGHQTEYEILVLEKP